jgi:hypothetical protein
MARISAAWAAFVSNALYVFAFHAKPSFLPASTPDLGIQIFWIAVSLLTAVPYMLLFIALSLLASSEEPATKSSGIEPDPEELQPDPSH